MKIRLSVNRHIVDKDIQAIARHNGDFRNLTLTLDEVAGVVQLGWAIAHVLKGTRKTENVLSAGFLAVDIDEGLTIEEALADPFTQAHAGLLYTTVSHTPESHRFRIFFPLEEDLTDTEHIRLAQVGLSARYGGDLAATDAPRLFAGSKDCRVEMLGKSLSPDDVESLLQLGREKVQTRRLGVTTGIRGAVRSRTSIPVDQMVRAANGEHQYLWDLPARTRVHCPNHADKRASAVTVLSSHGKPGIFCSTCQITMFPDSAASTEPTEYVAADVADLVRGGESSTPQSPLALFRQASVRRLNERFLKDVISRPELIPPRPRDSHVLDNSDDLPPGLWVDTDVLCVVSGTGTGKTHMLKAYIGELLRLNANVLLLGSRRVLLAEQSAKLGLTNYLRDDGKTFHQPTQGYAMCIDSLPRLKPGEHQYDVVVIDECQSVFEHLQSETLRDNRRKVLQYLRFVMRKARQVVLLDAHLGKLTLEMTGELLRGLDRQCTIVMNNWKPENARINVYEDRYSPRQAVGDLIEALSSGQKCFVSCNSRQDAEAIAAEAPRHVPSRQLRVMCITATNSAEPSIQSFIRNIRSEMREYDLVVVSPSMSSGVDVTFPDEERLFRVFGIYRPLTTTHWEMDQQLARIRQPISVNVWISAEEFAFECDPAVIQAEIWSAESNHHNWHGVSDDGTDEYQQDPLWDMSYVTVAAHRRASLNSLRRNFIRHKEATGWTVNLVPASPLAAQLGAAVLEQGKASQKATQRERILAAPKINPAEYSELRWQRKFKQLPREAEPQMRRFEIEVFYDTDISEELLALDDGGRGREAVRNLTALTASDAEIQQLEELDRRRPEGERMEWRYRREVLSGLLGAAGLFSEGVLRTDVDVNQRLLGAFVMTLEGELMGVALQRLFKTAPRKDSGRKPVRQLTEVLKLLGLRKAKAGRNRRGGSDVVSFRLDEDSVRAAMGHVERRRRRGMHDDGLPNALQS